MELSTSLVFNRHPILVGDEQHVVANIMPGETLGDFLARTVPEDMGGAWEVIINGQLVPYEVLSNRSIRPKPGARIVVRSIVNKQALYIVSMIALTYFTFGIGAAAGAAAGGYVATTYGVLAASAVYVAGAVIINKLLGPKPEDLRAQERDTVFSLSGSRNQIRLNEPLPLVFGRVKFAPDIISAPYNYYVGNTQRVGVVLTPGINCSRFEPLYMGDTLLTDFDDAVRVYQSGFPAMVDTGIPLYTDADTISGGALTKDRTWVNRNLPPLTQMAMFNIEYILGDADSKGRPYPNKETVEIQYRQVGASTWLPLASQRFQSRDTSFDTKRATIMANLNPDNVYETRTRIIGEAMDGGGSNGRASFSLGTIIAVQKDETDYRGIRRIGLDMTATGKLQGTPDEITGVMVADPIPVWKGDALGYVLEESSNPGAQILAYCRGFFDDKGQLVAGMGLPDDDIDIDTLNTFTLHCAANNYFYDFVLRDTRNHEDVINAIALVGFGQLDSKDGRISVVWAAEDQPNEGVANMATMERGSFSVAYSLANEADGIEYTYYDRNSWELKTLRIPFPGVESILSPSRITGEGVGTEAHAAQLARFHAAQQLYQKRDISYSTDLSHMAYRRMAKLSMSHDLTQWSYSGQLLGVSGNVVTLTQTVPPNANGKSYIGIQIPGAANYRVMECVTVGGAESRQVQLVEPWPADLPLPGGQYQARDYTWVYDFKATPGHSVRVVSIEPEDDLRGARISVVSEGPEYWLYVKTGEYIPPTSDSLLQVRPVASRLVIGERQVVQGDTVFTELIATFDVTGPVGRTVVMMADEEGVLEPVAETITRTASWRIPEAGTYRIVVRPFSPDGQPGVAVATIYSTIGADAPPVLVDLFDVQERSGGVRLYTWGWLTGTTQSADFAGVEIRYLAGAVATPDWDAMTPVGTDGYYTAPFEAVVPESGQWTFAARSRNTSGTLSTGMRVVTKTLGANLGEQIGGIGTSIDYITQQQVAQQALIDQAASDAAQAQAAAAEALALAGTPWNDTTTWPTGAVVYEAGRMYRALQMSVGVQPPNPAYWQDIGTITEAQGATTQAISQLRTDVDEQGDAFAAAIIQVQSGVSRTDFTATLTWDFRGSYNDFTFANANVALFPVVSESGMVLDATADDPQLLSPGFSVSGRDSYVVRALIRRRTPGAWDGLLLWQTDSHGFGGDHFLMASAPPADGQFHTVEWDLSSNMDWRSSQINRVRIDLEGNAGTTTDIRWISIGSKASDGNPSSGSLSSATFALQVAQDAQTTLTTNVNGHVSGMVSKNDGQRSVISFLADVFEIITSGSIGVRFTRRNGGYFMRFYAASVQTILGINFGASNNLCFWYGPNVGEENCTKQNGTIWFDNAGSAYFKGAIIAGTIRNGGYSSSTAINTTYTEGPFGTLGGPISVNASYAFSQILTANNTTSTYTKGSGSNQATLQLWRKVGTGALEMVAQTVATGSLDVIKDGDTPAQAVYAINGSITYTDTAGGTAQRTFEVRMLNRQQQIVNISGGATGNTQTSQATGIQTAEG